MTLGVTSQRPSTPAQPTPRSNSTARLVRLWGWSRFVVVVGDVGRSVAQSVEVTPKRSKERGWQESETPGTESQNESETRETESQKVQSTWPARMRLDDVKASGNLHTKSSRPGLSSAARQSAGFWHPVDLACSSVAGRVKASGSPVELACLIQRDRTSEVFW